MVTTQRTWRIKKGSFAEFHRVSAGGVWPYFERIGARIIGMWVVTEDEHEPTSSEYDSVILVTRYESREHWKATRDFLKLGGEGHMYDACVKALQRRRELTIDTWLRWLDDGVERAGGPYYKDRVGF